MLYAVADAFTVFHKLLLTAKAKGLNAARSAVSQAGEALVTKKGFESEDLLAWILLH